jgi:hypothetical protein
MNLRRAEEVKTAQYARRFACSIVTVLTRTILMSFTCTASVLYQLGDLLRLILSIHRQAARSAAVDLPGMRSCPRV